MRQELQIQHNDDYVVCFRSVFFFLVLACEFMRCLQICRQTELPQRQMLKRITSLSHKDEGILSSISPMDIKELAVFFSHNHFWAERQARYELQFLSKPLSTIVGIAQHGD